MQTLPKILQIELIVCEHFKFIMILKLWYKNDCMNYNHIEEKWLIWLVNIVPS